VETTSVVEVVCVPFYSTRSVMLLLHCSKRWTLSRWTSSSQNGQHCTIS